MKFWFFRASLFFLLIATTALNVSSQTPEEPIRITVSPEKGVHFESADGFMEFRVGFRLQQQIAFTQIVSDPDVLQGEYLIRRERALFRGFLFHNKLDYFVQLGMDQGRVTLLNAEYRWKPDSYTQISFGQFFPPTFRQFQTISQNLQMVDRSNVSRFFFTDYDLGVRVRRTLPVAENFQFKVAGALTHGEGKNLATAPGGWAYMGRFEILPLGAFQKGGDYSESDLVREKTPKLSFGAGFYLNHDAYTQYGNAVWDGLDDDILDTYADVIFKYDGFSFLAEYIHRKLDNEMLLMDSEMYSSEKISGDGFYAQSGKFIDKHIEFTARFSYLNPDDIHHTQLGKFTNQAKYSVGFNYFFIGHHLKLQSEFGYVSEEFAEIKTCNYFEFLTQFTISF